MSCNQKKNDFCIINIKKLIKNYNYLFKYLKKASDMSFNPFHFFD